MLGVLSTRDEASAATGSEDVLDILELNMMHIDWVQRTLSLACNTKRESTIDSNILWSNDFRKALPQAFKASRNFAEGITEVTKVVETHQSTHQDALLHQPGAAVHGVGPVPVESIAWAQAAVGGPPLSSSARGRGKVTTTWKRRSGKRTEVVRRRRSGRWRGGGGRPLLLRLPHGAPWRVEAAGSRGGGRRRRAKARRGGGKARRRRRLGSVEVAAGKRRSVR
ncbi:hypothetical protein GUJ93_ZPchr0012g20558 [Zizania palustris]|uniref:Uncharacterized protein n=1 Tax=Zizania palustris TaxID=103762 RepID=A0A8J5WPW6_ZIZPA|nr:hypothetical protein GUJ93_ZPchr0012g20558 [Zizania palustris]